MESKEPNIRELPTMAPDEVVVQTLEKLLEKAKAGELRTLAAVTELSGGSMGYVRVGDYLESLRMVGACEELKLYLLDRITVSELVDILEG